MTLRGRRSSKYLRERKDDTRITLLRDTARDTGQSAANRSRIIGSTIMLQRVRHQRHFEWQVVMASFIFLKQGLACL